MSMYGEEFTEERGHAYPLSAYPLTADEAYTEAQRQLCALSPLWCDATNAQIKQHICYDDCSLFVGNDPLRLAICGTYQCPVTAPPPPAPGEGINTTLILGVAALVAVGAVALVIASKGTKKKVLVAKARD